MNAENSGSRSQAAGPDSQLLALIDTAVQDRMNLLEQGYRRDIAAWDEALQAERHSKNALQGELESLRAQLLAVQSHSGPGSAKALVDVDTQMEETSPVPIAAPVSPPHSSSARRQRRIPEPVPEQAPARNLRQSVRTNRSATTALPKAAKPSQPPLPLPNIISPLNAASLTQKQVTKTRKPAGPKHKLQRAQLPQDLDIRGTEVALSLHLRLLWGLLNAKDVPEDPHPEVLSIFSNHVSTQEQLFSFRESQASHLISPTLVKIGTAASVTKTGKIANQIRNVEEHMINYIHSYLARFGLVRWCPDLRQSAYSLYNSACRIVALDTFVQALVADTYAHVSPNRQLAKDLIVLAKIYDHIVHHRHFLRYQRNSRNPGCVKASDEASPTYQNRRRLAEARKEFLTSNRYPQRYVDLIDPKATSDDEADPENKCIKGRKVFYIKKRRERSSQAEAFIRLLDLKREEDAALNGKRVRERIRLVPDVEQKLSDFAAIPSHLPVDYYDPDIYNSLQPRIRDRIAIQKISLLPNVSESFGNHTDEKLSDSAFMEKYGLEVLSRYRLDDLSGFDEEEWLEGDEDDEMYSDGEYDEDASIIDNRMALVAHLSTGSV